MARHNYVHIYGVVDEMNCSKEQGYVFFWLKVVLQRRQLVIARRYGDVDNIPVFTRDPTIIKEILRIGVEDGDLVDVQGVLASYKGKQRVICPHCGKPYAVPDIVQVRVVPAMSIRIIEKRRPNTSIEDNQIEKLRPLKEHNWQNFNLCYLIGYVSQPPKQELFSPSTENYYCRMELSVNRKIRLADDPPKKKTDFLQVTSFGDLANKNYMCLMQGSLVFIEGCVATYTYERVSKCPHCELKQENKFSTLNVEALATEYLQNFETDYLDESDLL